MGTSASSLAGIQGFQVGRVLPNSPAHLAGLCPFFDIWTGLDGTLLDIDSMDYVKAHIQQHRGVPIALTVYNLRVRVYRTVELVPSDEWGGVGLLGCGLEWNTAERALESTWQVLDVQPDGPAGRGEALLAGRDYIIGMQVCGDGGLTLLSFTSFADCMEAWRARREGRPLDTVLVLLVFDSEANAVREVGVDMQHAPSLGIDIADGYLHFIPPIPIADPSEAPQRLPVFQGCVGARPSQPAPAMDASPTRAQDAPMVPAPAPLPTAAPVLAPPATPQPRAAPTFPEPPIRLEAAKASNGPANGPPPAAPAPVFPKVPTALPFPQFALPPTPAAPRVPPPVRPGGGDKMGSP